MYSLIKSNNYRGREFKTSISLVELRDFLGLTDKEYSLYSLYSLYANFKVQIEKNLKEIKDKAGLNVKLHERKTGKKVSLLVFVVETT